MIQGGELTSRKITFDVGFANAAHHLQTGFSARSNFFFVPPYNDRIDIDTTDNLIHFFRRDGADLCYEDAKYILGKALLFQAIEPDKFEALLIAARESLPCVSTLLFPDRRRTLVECAVYENWARFDFHGRQFGDLAQKVRADITNYFPPNIKVTANTAQELTLRTDNGERLLLSHEMLKKLATVLVSYGVLPPELHHRFILNAEQFALMQGVRIYLHHTLYAIKDAETVGGVSYATHASEQILRVLKQLAEDGDLGSLHESDAIFLTHVQLFSPKEYHAFDGVHGLRKFMEQFIVAYGPDITMLHNLRVHEESAAAFEYNRVHKDRPDIIEGSTEKVIDREEEYRLLAGHYQKRLEQ